MAREGGGGREGDWECSGCSNRNYAFRSFCNRCKQPRLLVDTKTPSDSKWRPRIGDWICSGCTNNNYASREICKKCGQRKEVAAMTAAAIPGASVPTHPTYFARGQGGMDQMMNIGLLHQSLALSSSFPLGDANRYGNRSTDPYGVQQTPWHLGGNTISGLPFPAQTNQIPALPNGNGWRDGDWLCKCGFHNYSSRTECKKCNAPTTIGTPSSLVNPAITALGTKRMASEEIEHWEHKRLNAGQAYGLQQPYPGYDSFPSIYPANPHGRAEVDPHFQVNLHFLRAHGTPALLGKGAKQWRDGDWMCSKCNNHNYASRDQCNRCKSQREPAEPVDA